LLVFQFAQQHSLTPGAFVTTVSAGSEFARHGMEPHWQREGENKMKVMVIVKADKDSESGMLPTEASIAAMMKFNEELAAAGIMLSGDGLRPSSAGKRVRTYRGKISVIDGPFAAPKELITGYWVWRVGSMDEAVDWAKRIPNPDNVDQEIEIRPYLETADFGEAFTPELKAKEESLRAKLESPCA
jgi:hypothetical protein